MEKKNVLGNKQIFIFNVYVGNIKDEDVENYLKSVSDKNEKFNNYLDVVTFYIPTRDEAATPIIRI